MSVNLLDLVFVDVTGGTVARLKQNSFDIKTNNKEYSCGSIRTWNETSHEQAKKSLDGVETGPVREKCL